MSFFTNRTFVRHSLSAVWVRFVTVMVDAGRGVMMGIRLRVVLQKQKGNGVIRHQRRHIVRGFFKQLWLVNGFGNARVNPNVSMTVRLIA